MDKIYLLYKIVDWKSFLVIKNCCTWNFEIFYNLGYSDCNIVADHRRNTRTHSINYEMIEDTLLACLNLTRNPNSLKRLSHTILQYFTHVVFNQIKNNYYKQLSRKRKNSWERRHESTVLFFNRKYSCAYALCKRLQKKVTGNCPFHELFH